MEHLADLSAERAVLGGIFCHGNEAYLDVADFLKSDTFYDPTNQAVFRCFKHLFEVRECDTLDEASIRAAASEIGMDHLMERPEDARFVRSIINARVSLSNVRRWAGKLRKLQISRMLIEQLDDAKMSISALDGSEPVEHILGLAENAIFDFTSLISNEDDSEPSLITDGLEEYLDWIESNPIDQVGISSGLPLYDFAIGGGFRRRTVSLIGARPKMGKSMLSVTIALHVARTMGIPVLYLDTEMTKKDHWSRLMPRLGREKKGTVTIRDFETGQYSKDEFQRQKIREAFQELKASGAPFYYKDINGKPFEDILGFMRRWIHKTVGTDEDGTTKDCLIIYDYMKLMSADAISDGLREYQIMGFMMTTLHNFAVRHDVPICSLIQLNREGERGESTAVISQSDRILWLVTNFCIFRDKTPEEIVEMGRDGHGNRKMVPMVARHGEGLESGDYINMNMDGKYAFITEGMLRSAVMRGEATAAANETMTTDDNNVEMDDEEQSEALSGSNSNE